MTPFASVSDMATLLRRTFSGAESAAAQLILEDVSALIRTEAGMDLRTATADSIVIDGHGGPAVLLPEWPVTAVASVAVKSWDGAGVLTTTALAEHVDYEWSATGVLTAASGKCSGLLGSGFGWGSVPVYSVASWPRHPRCIAVVYDHGPDSATTDLLRGICLGAAARTLVSPEGNVKETIGNYSYDRGAIAVGAGLLDAAELAAVHSLRTARVA